MTNSISGILSLPQSWSLNNFREAMEVTDFWRSLSNSLLITLVAVGLSIVVHSLMGYALGRNKAKNKFYSFVYLFIVSGILCFFVYRMTNNDDPDGSKAAAKKAKKQQRRG